MTYFYKKGMYIARKEGGEPPSDTYIAINPQNEIVYIKNGQIIEDWNDIFPDDFWDKGEFKQYSESERRNLLRLYAEDKAMSIAKSVLLNPKVWRKKKTMKPKSTRKVKVVKKCTCK